MQKIEALLLVAFAKPEPGEAPVVADGAAAPEPEPEPAGAAAVPLPPSAPAQYTPAFAAIDEVNDGGPAGTAGLCVGDELVSFGGLTAADLRGANGRLNLQPLALKVRDNEGRALAVVVQRAGQYHELELTPVAWAGQGLLGCHLQPL